MACDSSPLVSLMEGDGIVYMLYSQIEITRITITVVVTCLRSIWLRYIRFMSHRMKINHIASHHIMSYDKGNLELTLCKSLPIQPV
jgi:hypothetical protein